jgi:hypothetical protein
MTLKGAAEERRFVTDLARTPSEAEPTVMPLRPMEERAPSAVVSRVQQELQRECEAMLQHALDKGKEIPLEMAQRAGRAVAAAAVPPGNDAGHFAELTILHNELSTLIAPASGRTLVLLEQERKSHPFLYVFGPVRLVRQMLAFAVFALLTTSTLSTLSTVNVSNVARGLFDLNGADAVCVLTFLLSVAALGASFSNLSIINRYIEQANYDPTYEGSYWVRIVLGLISGVVLGEILFDLLIHSQLTDASPIKPAGERIVLAFLGGFATAPVQRLLTNLSDAVGTLLQGRGAQSPREHRPPATRRSAHKRPGEHQK